VKRLVVLALVAACGDLRAAAPNPDAGTRPDDAGVTNPNDGGVQPSSDGGSHTLESVVTGFQPQDLAVDDENIYFTDSATKAAFSCAKSGCVKSPVDLLNGNLSGVLVIGTTLFFANGSKSEVDTCARDGCSGQATVPLSNTPALGAIATNGTDLFWTELGTSSFYRCPGATCSDAAKVTLRTSGVFASTIAASGDNLVFVSPGDSAIYTCKDEASCAAPLKLGSLSETEGQLTTANGVAYWTNPLDGRVQSCAITGCTEPVDIVKGHGRPSAIAVDATNVYFRDLQTLDVLRCPVAGCSGDPDILALDQDATGAPRIVLDADYIYWTTKTSVVRLHK
jgi:hypothetical protein